MIRRTPTLVVLAAACGPTAADGDRYVELLEAKAVLVAGQREGDRCDAALREFDAERGKELGDLTKKFTAGALLELHQRHGARVTAAEREIRQGCRTDQLRLLDIQHARSEALDRAGPVCEMKASALRTFDANHVKEERELLARLAASGKPEKPLVGADQAKFEDAKQMLVQNLEKCIHDPEFQAAMQASGQ